MPPVISKVLNIQFDFFKKQGDFWGIFQGRNASHEGENAVIGKGVEGVGCYPS
jgi:hypothetical protein